MTRPSDSELLALFQEWKQWSATADSTEDGWESDFPKWEALMKAASQVMTTSELDSSTLEVLAECWSIAQEGEELLSFACARPNDCWPILQELSRSSLPGCRWQIYDAAAQVGQKAEGLLRRGLSDRDGYARRRALLSLARLRPNDARSIAETFLVDPDPYLRQAAINMVLAANDAAFQKHALQLLGRDAIDHVRSAAQDAARQL
jgi:hypothetical protein